MHKGNHILVDCRSVSKDVCLNDKDFLAAMAWAAETAGATVINQCRYKFGHNSPPGFTAVCLLDESHISAHTYADLGLIALDIFTCGDTDPREVIELLTTKIDLGNDVDIRQVERFITE